jgi:hypothetical protein
MRMGRRRREDEEEDETNNKTETRVLHRFCFLDHQSPFQPASGEEEAAAV